MKTAEVYMFLFIFMMIALWQIQCLINMEYAKKIAINLCNNKNVLYKKCYKEKIRIKLNLSFREVISVYHNFIFEFQAQDNSKHTGIIVIKGISLHEIYWPNFNEKEK